MVPWNKLESNVSYTRFWNWPNQLAIHQPKGYCATPSPSKQGKGLSEKEISVGFQTNFLSEKKLSDKYKYFRLSSLSNWAWNLVFIWKFPINAGS